MNNDGTCTQYKPVSVGNRGNGQDNVNDFINENCEMVRKLSFSIQLSDPDDYEGGNVQLLDEAGNNYIVHEREDVLYCLTPVHNTEF